MRYALAALLALGIGVVGIVPAALADGEGCYSKGVAHDCVSPSPVYIGTGSDSTTVAGPTMQSPSGPFQDWRLQNMGMRGAVNQGSGWREGEGGALG